MDIIIVVGARPNFVKVGPIMPVLAEAGHRVRIAHTGQHYDASMSDVFFADLKLPHPDWYLGVGSGKHAVQTAAAMVRLEELLETERPDAVLVVGDVNSTLAAALAAAKLLVPVIHLEAGLRSFDMAMPEEVNRLVTDQLSALLLAPTVTATENLGREGIDLRRVDFVGNVMAQALIEALPLAAQRSRLAPEVTSAEYALATIHRPENTSDPARLAGIMRALAALELPVVLPAHPRLAPLLEQALPGPTRRGVTLIEPAGYLDMLRLEREAALVVTDSGGVQEEACMLHVPCVTVRRNTERVETIDIGANRLTSADPEHILETAAAALASDRAWPVPERWDERVAERVAAAIGSGVTPLRGAGT